MRSPLPQRKQNRHSSAGPYLGGIKIVFCLDVELEEEPPTDVREPEDECED
jgi:hypothetical protein